MGETEKRGEKAKVFKKGGKQGQGVGALKRGDWNLFMKYVQVLLKKPPKKQKKALVIIIQMVFVFFTLYKRYIDIIICLLLILC